MKGKGQHLVLGVHHAMAIATRAEVVRLESGDEMTDLLTALHLSVMLLDLKIRMMEAINEDRFDLAMTYHLLILVRTDELAAHKWAMSPQAWSIYETIHP